VSTLDDDMPDFDNPEALPSNSDWGEYGDEDGNEEYLGEQNDFEHVELPGVSKEVQEKEAITQGNPAKKVEQPSVPTPPSNNAAQQMVTTFTSIYEATTELVTLVNVTLNHIQQVTEVTDNKNIEMKEIVERYNIARKSIFDTISQTQNYFDQNKEVVKDLSQFKRAINKDFEAIKEDLLNAQSSYATSLKLATEKITKHFEYVAESINTKPIVEALEKELTHLIKKSSVDSLSSVVSSIEDTSIKLNVAIEEMVGNDSKVGLVGKLLKNISTLNTSLEKMQFKVNFLLMVPLTITSFFLGGAFAYSYATKEFSNTFATTITDKTMEIDSKYKTKIDNLELKLKAFQYLEARGVLQSGKVGFSFFNDTKTPFLYYPVSAKSFIKKDKVIVEID